MDARAQYLGGSKGFDLGMDAELDAVETQLDIGLPSEVREWFKWADGFGGPNGMPNFLLGFISTYSLQGAVAEFGVFDDDSLLARVIHRDQVKHAPDWVQHRQVRQTFPILSCDYQLGVECEGPAVGGVFFWGLGEGGWTARSLTELVERAISFVDRGWSEVVHGNLVFREEILVAAGRDFVGGRSYGMSVWLQDFDEFSPSEWNESLFWRWG